MIWLLATLLRRLNRTTVVGAHDAGPRLYAVNHVSFTDVYLIGCVLVGMREPLCYVAKRELATAPILGWVYRQLGTIFVDRDNPDRATLETCIRAAQRGPLLIFPEGTRSRDLSLGEGKAGVGVIARRARVPVIPVTAIGTERPVWQLALGWLFPAWRVRIQLGAPYTPQPGIRSKEMTEAIMCAIAAQLPPERRGRYGTVWLDTPLARQ